MRRRRERTVAISLCDRGQTTQDFVVGIGLFLLAVAFVFSFVPTMMTPFDSSGGTGETAQADRIGATIVENLSDGPERPNHLNATTFDNWGEWEDETFAKELGLRYAGETPIDRINITIESLGDPDAERLSAGSTYDGQTGASATRIVTVDDSGSDDIDCDPACRLVVRIW